jgi:hypothetical protein
MFAGVEPAPGIATESDLEKIPRMLQAGEELLELET